MRAVVKYQHHGKMVSVFRSLKGHHRDYCLCWANCKFFKPNSEDNCQIARVNFDLDVMFGVVTPVFECPKYVQKKDVSELDPRDNSDLEPLIGYNGETED